MIMCVLLSYPVSIHMSQLHLLLYKTYINHCTFNPKKVFGWDNHNMQVTSKQQALAYF